MLSLRSIRSSARPWLVRWYATAPSADAAALDTSLRTALKASMKARDSFRSGVLKSVLADLQNAGHLASPPPAHKTLSKAIASRLDGAKQFMEANPPRKDLADQYESEAAILKEFTAPEPEAMDELELDKLIQKVMTDFGISSMTGKEIGKVIKAVTEQSGGKALARQVAEAIKKLTVKA